MTQIKTKLSAVRQVIEGSRSQLSVAREYGVGRASIYDWIKQHHAGADLSGPIVQREKHRPGPGNN
jgi:transposase-like protein